MYVPTQLPPFRATTSSASNFLQTLDGGLFELKKVRMSTG